MARRYGRSPRGQRAYAKVPFGTWKRLSVLSALGIEGVLATMSIDDATDGDTFAAYLDQVLLPVLRQRKPDAVLVMDNLRPHKTPEVQAVLDGSGFPYRYLPSYSPDLSPIEPGWAKVKSYLRRVAARTSRRCNTHSLPRSTASPLRMPLPSSDTVAMPVPTDLWFAVEALRGMAAQAPVSQLEPLPMQPGEE